jgi:hypothetical protein
VLRIWSSGLRHRVISLNAHRRFGGTYCLVFRVEALFFTFDGDKRFVRNAGKLRRKYTMLQPRRPQFSPLWKPHISSGNVNCSYSYHCYFKSKNGIAAFDPELLTHETFIWNVGAIVFFSQKKDIIPRDYSPEIPLC